jgi:5-methylcytosine-specific restriction enzyme A
MARSPVWSEITPTKLLLVRDLVRSAGIDVSDWGDYKGGEARAAANPKYCYEWSFVKPKKLVVLNVWVNQLVERDSTLVRDFNTRTFAQRTSPVQKRRALKMASAIQEAYFWEIPIRMVVCDGPQRGVDGNSKSSVTKRSLDPVSWAVTVFDEISGKCIITRGAKPGIPNPQNHVNTSHIGFEGTASERFSTSRTRDARLRKEKIAQAKQTNNGRLICEVPDCGFDFVARYGEIGIGFIHVHHKTEMNKSPKAGRIVTLDELATVCANWHAMIHAGGECRAIEDLVLYSR